MMLIFHLLTKMYGTVRIQLFLLIEQYNVIHILSLLYLIKLTKV